MNDPKFVEHVIDHYLARDEYRLELLEYAKRVSVPWSLVKNPNYHDYDRYLGGTPSLLPSEVHKTRMSLRNIKPASLAHIHLLLHRDDMLEKFEHAHFDDEFFRYIIEEVVDGPF